MEKYYSTTTYKVYDETMTEVRSFKYTNDVKGLTQVIRRDTAGDKQVYEGFVNGWWGDCDVEDIGGGWYAVHHHDFVIKEVYMCATLPKSRVVELESGEMFIVREAPYRKIRFSELTDRFVGHLQSLDPAIDARFYGKKM